MDFTNRRMGHRHSIVKQNFRQLVVRIRCYVSRFSFSGASTGGGETNGRAGTMN